MGKRRFFRGSKNKMPPDFSEESFSHRALFNVTGKFANALDLRFVQPHFNWRIDCFLGNWQS